MLDDHAIPYRYRDTTREPLSASELRQVLGRLGLRPADVLRARDAKAEGLSGQEDDETLIAAMAGNPNLVQRPIGILGERAVVGRPVERLLELS